MSYNRGGSYYNPRYGGKKYGAGSNQSGANSHGEAPNSANSAHPNTNTHPPEDRVRDETYFGSSTGGSGYRRDRERERERERDYYGHYRSNSRYEGKYNKYAGGYSNSGPGAKRSTSTYYGTASEAAGNNQASVSAAGSSANAGSSYRPHRYDSYGKYADRDKHAERDTVRDKKDRDGSDKEKYADREKHISPMSGSTSPQDYRGSRRASISRDSRKSSIDGNMDKPLTISTSKFSDGRRGVAVTAGTNNTNNSVNNSRPALSQSKLSIDLKKTEKASKTEQPRPELRSSKLEAKLSISETNDVKYERRYDERRDDKRYDERRDDKRYDERRDDRRYDDRRSDGYNERRRSRLDDPSDKSADVPEREVKSEKDVPTETDKPERSKAKVTSTMTGSKSMFGKPDAVEKRELHKVDKKEPENDKLDTSPKPAETESNEVKPDTKQDKPTDITDPNLLHLFDDDYEVQNDSKKEACPKPIESQLENDEKIQSPVEGDAEPVSATSSNSSKLGENAIQEDYSVPVELAANLQISNSENSENTMNSSNSINSANSDNSVNSANSANSNSASGTENIPSRDSPESDTDSNSDKQNSAKTKSNLSSENKPAVSTTNDQSNTQKEPKKKVTSFSDYLTSKKGKSPETGPETTAIEPVVAAETTDENTQNKPNTAEEDLSDSTTTTQKAAGSTVGSDSTLTPIRDASTDAFDFNNLATIAEDKGKEEPQSAEEDSKSDVGAKSNNENADEIVSEAETIPTDSPPALNRSRRLVRKKDFDEKRHKLKRKLVYSSDEEEHQSKNHKRKHVYFSEDDNDKGYTSDHKSKQGYSSDEKNRHKLGYSSEEEQLEQSGDKNQRKLKPYKLKRDSQGRSLLQRACKKGSLRDIRSYFARGANANEKDFCGFTCLHEAALEGHTDVVKLLLEKGANVNAKADAAGDCETPLIDAAENKHLLCVRALLENGADPSIFNIDGFTALTKIYNQHSNETGYEEIITLLENAAKSYSTKPVRGKLSTVEDPNDTYFADLIKKRGIYKFAAEGFKENTANYFVSGNSLASKPDVLILAARNGHVELVDIILGLNPTPYDIDTESECGVTALLASVGRGHIDIVESLLCKNADPFKTRKPDSLNALEIAQRSAYYSAKECGLIEEFMHKKELLIRMEEVVQQRGEEGSRRKELESERDKKADSSEKREKHDKHERCERQERLERTDRHEKLEKQETVLAKQSDKETLPSEDKDVSGVDADNSLAAESCPAATPSRTPGPSARHSPAPSIPHSSTHSLKHSPAVSDDESKHPTSEVIKKRKQEPMTMSPSPTPLTKAQEELKAKNAEEARAWQEKVEAKKRARRDMFLKSEKEKERRRREEEQHKVDEKNRLAVLHEQERLRLAKEVEEQARVLQLQRRILRNQLRLESFPAGLRNFKMRKQFSVNEVLQYTPIYVFDIDGAKYITDLQLTLLLGVANSKINAGTRRQASSLEKSKMWDLFFYMVGIDKSKPVKDVVRLRNEGFAHFKNLMISFVKLDDAAKFVQLEHPDAYSYIWADFAQSSTEVVLESMQPFEPSKRNLFVVEDELQVVVDTKEITSLRFVPPKLRRRKDTLRTISSASKPLW